MAEGKIIVKKPAQEELSRLGVKSWPNWEKEASTFNWEYSEKETCFILDGEAIVKSDDGKQLARFGKGDFVVFPKGIKCIWQITSPIRKHYKFG